MVTRVFTFGRMNPPTVGHGLLISKVIEIAKHNQADYDIWLSRTIDAKKNPLSVDRKVYWAKKMFPGTNIHGAPANMPTAINLVAEHYNGICDRLIMVVGSDRVPEFSKLLNKYNGNLYKFDSIDVISAGERDPDADGVSGMSASKMRAAATENDLDKFSSGLPNTLSNKDKAALMQELRDSMHLKESIGLLSFKQFLNAIF